MRVLVTGASGVIGTILLPRIAEIAQVIALDERHVAPDNPNVRAIAGSVEDADLVSELARECTHVVHLARGNPQDWSSLAAIDMNGTRNVLQSAANSGNVRRAVVASSNNVSGGFEKDLLRGKIQQLDPAEVFAVPRPDSEYAVAKLLAENYGRQIAETTDVGVSCIRIGMVRLDDDPERYLDEPGFDWIPGGKPGVLRRFRAVWLNHDDLWRIVHEELQATERYRLRYGVSDNPGRYWPLEVSSWR